MEYPEYQRIMKRVIDIAIAIAALMVSWPLFVVIALAIKLDSQGPIFFCQQRVGYRQRRFTCYKFRTMRVGNNEGIHKNFIDQLMTQKKKGDGAIYKMTNDPRITHVGRILRKFSIDELPQIFNVLEGQMSIVGPRPAIDYELPYHDENMLRRFTVMPGITGLWQIGSRYSVDYKQMVAMDLDYVDHWSLWLDFKIIFKTVPVVLKIHQSF
jgi:lipopolysaccharide/colanic/teichoic acid biosynthesis glycosyltransferase